MSTQTNAQTAQPKAYNLHTVGMGFVNRLRFVKPEGKGKGYWCVSIGALYGVEDENGRSESSLFDLRVVGKLAIQSMQTLQAAFNEGKKIFVDFKAGDTRSEHYQYKNGAFAILELIVFRTGIAGTLSVQEWRTRRTVGLLHQGNAAATAQSLGQR